MILIIFYALFLFSLETTLGLKDPESLDGKSRDKIFERGAQFDKKGKRKLALKCYLACLTGLKEDSSFNFLPQCLHNVCIPVAMVISVYTIYVY